MPDDRVGVPADAYARPKMRIPESPQVAPFSETLANLQRELYIEQGRNLVEVIKSRIEALQASLLEGEELDVSCDAGPEQLRVESFEFPMWNLAVIVGRDVNNNCAHRIESVQDVKLTCKVMKVANPKRVPIGFTLPSEK